MQTMPLILGALLAASSAAEHAPPNSFQDHSDNGEVIHVLPTPASVRSPRDTAPTDAPVSNGTAVFPPSFGSGPLRDHGGPQIANASFQLVFWNVAVAGSTQTSLGYARIQDQLFAFAGAFSDGARWDGSATDDYTIVQQYGSRWAIAATLGAPAPLVDAQPTQGQISDSAIRSYLGGLFDAGRLAPSESVVYGVFFPPGMRIRSGGGSSCTSFCAYHGHFLRGTQQIKYAVFPYLNCGGCSLAGKSVADMLTITASHEVREAVTDPELNAWFDAAGYEADDKCAWHNLYQMSSGGFWVQPEYSNGGTVTASGFTATYPGPGCVVPSR